MTGSPGPAASATCPQGGRRPWISVAGSIVSSPSWCDFLLDTISSRRAVPAQSRNGLVVPIDAGECWSYPMEALDLVGDRFEILEQIKAGGMGEVFRARDCVTDAVVAIKVLSDARGHHAVRFEREIELLSEL